MSSGSLRASGELVRAYSAKHGEAERSLLAHGKHARAVLQQCHELAAASRSVLICGETGTGKTMVANLLHAQRAQAAPLKLINCAALSDALLADLMVELGDNDAAPGAPERTVLLDEIGELSPWGQAVLLRHLQHGLGQARPVRVRFLAATHRNLDAMITAGTFSRELIWRLNMARITLAPLRARPEEVEPLALHFLRLGLSQARDPFVSLDPVLARCLEAYDWPGNVRELKNAMFGALAVNESGTLSPLDLPDAVRSGAAPQRRPRNS